MIVKLVCPRCKERYAKVVDPGCRVCKGEGVLGVLVPEGVDPWVGARVVTMHLGDWWFETNALKKLAGLSSILRGPNDAVGLADEPQEQGQRAGVGRKAKRRLIDAGLAPPYEKRSPPTPTQKRTRAEIEADELEHERRMQEALDRRRLREAKEVLVETLLAQDPEVYGEMLEREVGLITLEDKLPWVPGMRRK